MHASRLLTPLLSVALLLAAAPAPAAAPAAQCIRARCNAQKKACLQSYQTQFTSLKAACSDRACRTSAKSFKRTNKKRCKQAAAACKQCCKADAAAACNVEVAGDGVCAGIPQPAEQCDGQDAAACPGQCSATCACSTTPGNPGGPTGDEVGEVSAAHTVVVELVVRGVGPERLRNAEGILILATFGTTTGGTTPQSERIGPCDVTALTGNETSGTFTALDAGSSGTAAVGARSTDLAPNGDPGALAPVESGITLFEDGFAPGAQIDFTFAGGADVGAFSTSVQVPADLGLSAPDVLDPSLRLDPTRPLELAWSPGDPSASIAVVMNATTNTASTVIACALPDTGTGTIPLAAMARLPAKPLIAFFSVLRASGRAVSVPLTGGGTGTVQASGASAIAWAFADQSPPVRR
jgi:hypothetical protein